MSRTVPRMVGYRRASIRRIISASSSRFPDLSRSTGNSTEIAGVDDRSSPFPSNVASMVPDSPSDSPLMGWTLELASIHTRDRSGTIRNWGIPRSHLPDLEVTGDVGHRLDNQGGHHHKECATHQTPDHVMPPSGRRRATAHDVR